MKLDYISARGDRLPLIGNELFHVTHVAGMTSAAASVSSSEISGADGSVVSNVRANIRSIIIDLRFKDDVDVEEAKRAVLKIVKFKQRGTLEWTHNNRTVTISGIVEGVDMPRWTNAVVIQITLHCSQPYWEDLENVVRQISEAVDLHYFTDGADDMLYFPEDGIALGEYDTIRTKSFHNDGDVAVGLEISIVAYDTVTNPIIYDGNGNFFGVEAVMHSGDNMVITTHKGNKSVVMDGKSLLSKIKPRSTWLQMEAGDNVFTINSDDDSFTNMTFSLAYKRRFV